MMCEQRCATAAWVSMAANRESATRRDGWVVDALPRRSAFAFRFSDVLGKWIGCVRGRTRPAIWDWHPARADAATGRP